MSNNIELWQDVEKTNPEYTKRVNDGIRDFTVIAPYTQIKVATEKWGPYGSNWGLYELDFLYNTNDELVLKAVFKYPNGQFPIASELSILTSKGKKVRDTHKKLITDVITKSLSYLGFNADVFLGQFDDNKYIEQVRQEIENETRARKWFDDIKKKIKTSENERDLQNIEADNLRQINKLRVNYSDIYEEFQESLSNRRTLLTQSPSNLT